MVRRPKPIQEPSPTPMILTRDRHPTPPARERDLRTHRSIRKAHPRHRTKAPKDQVRYDPLQHLWPIKSTLKTTVLEINLRLPSMLHGKKGFERIVWAFKNVLNHSVTWLFYDFRSSTSSRDEAQPPESQKLPLSAHHPFNYQVSPVVTNLQAVKVPPLTSSAVIEAVDDDGALEIHEWLGLVSLQSPRIQANDSIDPYLCRYEVPDSDHTETCSLVHVGWKGFIPAVWISGLFVELR